MQVQEMESTAEKVSDLMKVLSNKIRLMVLCQLVEGERSVGELAQALNVRDQAMSQQLSLLRKDGLVKPRREGQTVYYSLARGDIQPLMEFLYATYCNDATAETAAE